MVAQPPSFSRGGRRETVQGLEPLLQSTRKLGEEVASFTVWHELSWARYLWSIIARKAEVATLFPWNWEEENLWIRRLIWKRVTSLLIIFTHIIPFAHKTIQEGFITIEDAEVQKKSCPRMTELGLEPSISDFISPAVPQPPGHLWKLNSRKTGPIEMKRPAPCPQRCNAEQIHPANSAYYESYATEQFRWRLGLGSWIWNTACVLGHLYKKTISLLSQLQSHLCLGVLAFHWSMKH